MKKPTASFADRKWFLFSAAAMSVLGYLYIIPSPLLIYYKD